jgi:hypothetical protein
VGAQEVQAAKACKADEEVLSDRPSDLSRNNNADESVCGDTDSCFMADSVFEVKANIAVQP